MNQRDKERIFYSSCEEIDNQIDDLRDQFDRAINIHDQLDIESKINFLKRKRDDMESEVFNY